MLPHLFLPISSLCSHCVFRLVYCPNHCGIVLLSSRTHPHISREYHRTPTPCSVQGCNFFAGAGETEMWRHHATSHHFSNLTYMVIFSPTSFFAPALIFLACQAVELFTWLNRYPLRQTYFLLEFLCESSECGELTIDYNQNAKVKRTRSEQLTELKQKISRLKKVIN